MGDVQLLALFTASKIFKLDLFSPLNSDNRKYSFDGEVVYDFKRKSFARVFPVSQNEFKIFDYSLGDYLMVAKSKNNLGVYLI